MLALFAQAAGNGNDDFDDDDLVALGLLAGFFVLQSIIVVFFCLTLSKAITRCRPRNRAIEPAYLWLNLIPLFNMIWLFFTVSRVATTLRREFRSRGWSTNGDTFGQTLGIVWGVLSVLNCGCYFSGLLPLILMCRYWTRIANYSRELAQDDEYDDDEQDDDENNPNDDARTRPNSQQRNEGRDDDYDDHRRNRR